MVTEFAPGDEVWVVERDEDGAAVDFGGMIFVTTVPVRKQKRRFGRQKYERHEMHKGKVPY